MNYTINEAIEYLKRFRDLGYGDTLTVSITFPVTVSDTPSSKLNHICIYNNEK